MTGAVPNAQYNVAAPASLPVRIAAHQRRKMFSAFLALTKIEPEDAILDLGVTSDRTYDHSNYLEAWYPHKGRITAVGIDDARFLQVLYPGVRYVSADGRNLPFGDRAFDIVHSSAVLEHVGSREKQVRFLSESWRVARKAVFVTTPNRWFPVEFHTVLPLIHWLPTAWYRSLFTKTGYGFFANEDNLNLLSPRTLAAAARAAGMAGFEVDSVSLLGWPTNLLLIARKPSA